MSSIDRLVAHATARTYAQTAGMSPPGAARQAAKAHYDQEQLKSVHSVTWSDCARSLAVAREAVTKAPEVRELKVAELKQRIGDGRYSVPSRVLARQMLDSSSS